MFYNKMINKCMINENKFIKSYYSALCIYYIVQQYRRFHILLKFIYAIVLVLYTACWIICGIAHHSITRRI